MVQTAPKKIVIFLVGGLEPESARIWVMYRAEIPFYFFLISKLLRFIFYRSVIFQSTFGQHQKILLQTKFEDIGK